MKKYFLSGFAIFFFYACQPKGGNSSTQESLNVMEEEVTILDTGEETLHFRGNVKNFNINSYFILVEDGKQGEKPKEPSRIDEYMLDAQGRIIQQNSNVVQEGLYYEYTYHYDQAGRLVDISFPETSEIPETHTIYKYTPEGDTLSVYYKEEGYQMGGSTYENIITPEGKKIVKTFLGDGEYSKSECFYDKKGLLTKEILYGGEVAEEERIYSYNAQGKLIKKEVLGRSDTTVNANVEYQYNEHGDISQKVSKEQGTFRYTYRYDEKGNIIEKHISGPEYTIIKEYEINYQ